VFTSYGDYRIDFGNCGRSVRVRLQANEFFGIRLNEIATHFVNVPGSYTLLVEYKSTVSEEWAQKHLRLRQIPLWSMEHSTIVSNKVRIEVTK